MQFFNEMKEPVSLCKATRVIICRQKSVSSAELISFGGRFPSGGWNSKKTLSKGSNWHFPVA